MRFLWLLFVVVPLSEIYLLLGLSRATSFELTVLIVLVTAITGSLLAKRQGLAAYRQWQRAIDSGRVPEIGLVEGFLILIGGILLLTPGLITDVCGFLLLIPFTRRPLARAIKARLTAQLSVASVVVPSPGRTSQGPTVEGKGEALDDP